MPRQARIPKRPILKRVFLGCEGESERSYGAWLLDVAKTLKIPITIDTHPDAGGGDPPHIIIERSIIEMKNRQRLRGRYMARAILLDSDNLDSDPEKERIAISLARENGVHLIFQEFEHEAFLLRHLFGYENERPGKGEGRAALQLAWPEYKRRFGKIQLAEKLGIESLRRACSVESALRPFLTEIGFPV